jgi:site-specific DNA-cytosine methylase
VEEFPDLTWEQKKWIKAVLRYSLLLENVEKWTSTQLLSTLRFEKGLATTFPRTKGT